MQSKDGMKHIIDHKTLKFERQFKANGVQYVIRTPEEGMGLYRWQLFSSKFFPLAGLDTTLGQLRMWNRQALEEANKIGTQYQNLSGLFAALANFDEAIRRTERNWDFSLYAATLFITRPGESLDEWTEGQAEAKIEDWRKEGIHEADFFFLAMWWGVESSTRFQGLREAIHRELAASN